MLQVKKLLRSSCPYSMILESGFISSKLVELEQWQHTDVWPNKSLWIDVRTRYNSDQVIRGFLPI